MNNFGYYSPPSSNLEDPSQSGPETGAYIDEPEIEDLYDVFPKSGITNKEGSENKFKIEEDKQGRHIPGHRNFDPGRSEWHHPDPQV